MLPIRRELDGRALVLNSGTGGVFQIGPDNAAAHRLEVNIRDMRVSGGFLALGSQSLSTLPSAQAAITNLDLAIGKVA